MTYSPRPNSDGFFGGGKSVFRAGAGIYYGPGQVEDQIQAIESDRINATLTGSSTVRFDPNITGFVSTLRSGFINNPNNRQYQPRACTSEYLVPEKIYNFTVSYQQELPYKITGTVAYVGARGRNLFLRGLTDTLRGGSASILDGAALPTNAGVVNRTNAAGQTIGVTTVRIFDILNSAATAACGASAANAICRPFAEIDTKTSGAKDSYNSLQLSLARRIGNGLTLNAQYAFSRSFGTSSGSNAARTAAQRRGLRAMSTITTPISATTASTCARFNMEFRTEIFNLFNQTNFGDPASTLSSALPGLTFSTTANGGAGAFVIGSGLQPGEAFTQARAGSAFGLLRSTVERTVGLGTNRQVQFALRMNF